MKRFGVAGSPDAVANSLSPEMFAAAFGAAGIDAAYDRIPLADEREAAVILRELPEAGFSGANVTMPFKRIAAAVASSASPVVERTGVANTLVVHPSGRLHAEATDGVAVIRAVEERGIDIDGAHVALVGAGGASTEVAWACAEAGVGRLTIWNRTGPSAHRLAELVRTGFSQISLEVSPSLPIHVPAHVLVSAVPEAAWSLADTREIEGRMVVDLAYRHDRRPTVLTEAARANGCHVADGREILVRQAAEAFRLWFGADPPLEAMTDAVG